MNPLKTALIVIDMQADYIGEKSKHTDYPNALIGRINDRIAIAVNSAEVIIYVKQVGRRSKKPYVSDFAEGLSIASSFVFEKEKSSIFSNPALLDTLKQNGITNVELIGIDGNCCVAFSAIDASKLGFSVVLPLIYVGTKNKERFFKTREKLLQANVQLIE